MKHVLTFDIEDWFHIMEIDQLENRENWNLFPSIVEEKTHLILDILDHYEAKATFFILGWVAEKYPNIVFSITEKGHEVATHGYWHQRVYEQTPDEFFEDLHKSIKLLRMQTGRDVIGYRAPSFSITPEVDWAFDILSKLGIKYDASLFPAKRGHGGFPCNQEIHNIQTEKGIIRELPMSVATVGPFKVPFSGGGYLRALPLPAIIKGFRNFENRGIPAVLYLHPRDFAPKQPRVKMPPIRKFKSYIGLNTTEYKLITLLQKFEFTNCKKALGIVE